MNLQSYGKYQVTTPEQKRWNPKTNEEYTIPAKTETVEFLMDSAAILRYLGGRAIRSKGGRSVGMGGLIQIKVIKKGA